LLQTHGEIIDPHFESKFTAAAEGFDLDGSIAGQTHFRSGKQRAGWWHTHPSEKYESVGMIIPNIWKNKIHVPNHQPDLGFFL
jgi:hypothetical protein